MLINLNLTKEGDNWVYKITKFIDKHENHECTSENFAQESRTKRLTQEELDKYIGEYAIGMKVKNAKIREKIRQECGKNLSYIDLRNARMKYSGNSSDIEETLAVLDRIKMRDPDAFVRTAYTQEEGETDKTLKLIFCQAR